MKLLLSELDSPLGPMQLVTDGRGSVRALDFKERFARLQRNLRERHGLYELAEAPAPAAVADALQCYFAGDVQALDGIDITTGGLDVQRKAWAALRRIPVGQTTTYGALGHSLGITDWRAAVDMGVAVGANPIAVIEPCHRVTAANGDLKGYAWGLHRKRWLLEHEKAIQPRIVAPQTAALPGF